MIEGIPIAATSPMMATTTMISMSVNARQNRERRISNGEPVSARAVI
jgi:hypothetical protein